MVIAGGQWQIPIIDKIHSLGYQTLVVNLYPDSPAFQFSDYSEVCDILDKEACLKIAKKYNITGVLSEECDIAMPTVAYIGESLNLPSLSMESASLFTNKALMREFCDHYDLPSPRYRKCHNIEEAIDFLENTKFDTIIKPLDANSSRGVKTISTKEDLFKFWDETLSYSKSERAVLIEEYIEGPEFTVDGIMTPEGHQSLAISIKKHYAYNENIASELFFSNQSKTYNYDQLKKQNDMFVNLSNLRWGSLTHAEYKYFNGVFYLIEIAARGGGNLISSHIVPLISGIDNYAYYISSITSNNPIKLNQATTPNSECAVLKFFDFKETGIVKEIVGLEILTNNDDIIYSQLNFHIGERLRQASNDSQRSGFYIAKSSSEENLKKVISNIETNLRIITDEQDFK